MRKFLLPIYFIFLAQFVFAQSQSDLIEVESTATGGIVITTFEYKPQNERRPAKDNFALHEAVAKGDLSAVEKFIESGIPVDVRDNKGMTPLHIAAMERQKEIFEYLLTKGADISAENKRKETPLYFAIVNDSKEIAERLIALGAKVDRVSQFGETALHCAAKNGSLQVAELLCEKCPQLVNATGSLEQTPIFPAAKTGQDRIVALLLERGADVKRRDSYGSTPLHAAAEGKNAKVVELLIAASADINAHNRRDFTPLHFAAQYDFSEMVLKLLDKGANFHVTNRDGDSPVHIAVRKKAVKTFQILFDKGANVTSPDNNGNTPLHLAAESGSEEIVALLLAKGVAVSTTNKDDLEPYDMAAKEQHKYIEDLIRHAKETDASQSGVKTFPLHKAVAKRDEKLVKLLLDKGYSANATDSEGLTPICYGIEFPQTEILELLVTQGADVNVIGERGLPPLHQAVKNKDLDLIDFLIKHNADINMKNLRGSTALHEAIYCGWNDVAEYLMAKGADVNAVDRVGTPLHAIIQNPFIAPNFSQVFELLLKYNADINAKNAQGNTPLHFAAISFQPDAIEKLLNSGADVHAKDNDDLTPLHMACRFGNMEAVESLLNHGALIDCRDNKQTTPLHYAAACFAHEICGAFDESDFEKAKPYFTAILMQRDHKRNGFLPIVQCLLEKGAKTDEADANRRTPFFYAVVGGNTDIINLLLPHKAKPADKDNSVTPRQYLDRLIKRTQDLLLQNKGKWNQPDTKFFTDLLSGFQKTASYIDSIDMK